MRETFHTVGRLTRSGRVRWLRDPRDWFEYRIPGSFEIVDQTSAAPSGEGAWRLEPPPGEGAFATFELPEQMVGFPFLTVEAPAGTVVELMAQESHDPAGPAWLDTHRFSWTRFTCREGENRFESFDYESLRWLQVHVREATGPVLLRDVGVRRRSYPWPKAPSFACAEPKLQRVFDAVVQHARQRRPGDDRGRHGPRAPAVQRRRRRTSCTRSVSPSATASSRGASCGRSPRARRSTAIFLDCWPAFDRLARLAQRQVGATSWGPLLDHGVSFIYDCWHHYRETGETDLLLDLYPRFVRFADYLLARRGKDGLLPVEGWACPPSGSTNAYPRPRHKQCAFNLYAAAILKHGTRPGGGADRRLAGAEAMGAPRPTRSSRRRCAASGAPSAGSS